MTLRVSKNKINPTFGLFKSTVLKNSGIIILLVIAMLIFCPGVFLASLQDRALDPEDFVNQTPEYLDILFGSCGILSVIFVSVANYLSFSYLYKKNSSDVFHALPLTRSGLLLARAGAAFVTVLIPVTVGYISLFVLTAFYPTYVIGSFHQIASAYIMNIICMAFACAFSLIFILCAGSAFDLVLSFAGFNSALLVIGMIINSLADDYLTGYSDIYMTDIMRFISPIVFCGAGATEFAMGEAGKVPYSLISSAGFVTELLAITAVFFIASIILYNHRKTERGGQAYAYKFIYIICSVLAGICGGYLLSRIFIFAADAKDISFISAITFIAGALITSVIYGAVTERGFKKFKSALVYGGFSAVAYIIILAVIFTGAFGFSKRVPEAKDIKNVYVRFQDENVELSAADCAKVLNLHKAVIDRDADDDMEKEVRTPHTYLFIEYKLSNSSSMRRDYFVDINKVDDEMFALYTSSERFGAMYRDIEDFSDGTIDLSVYRYGKAEGGDFDQNRDYIVSAKQLRMLVDTYRAELQKVGKKILTGENTVMQITACLRDQKTFAGRDLDFSITDDFTQTLALIDTFELREDVLGE